MDKTRKLKGFTLIELMIVLAIFAVILSLVLSFIDPVAKLMKNTSTRERTASYVDNIGEYINNSLHYARYMRIYNGDFCDKSNAIIDSDVSVSEIAVAKMLVDDVLDEAVDSKGNSIKGRVRVLKFINDSITGCGVEGQIYESVYNFTAGANITVTEEEDGEKVEKTVLSEASVVTPFYINQPVINEEHLEEYCYYYIKGYYTLDAIKDPENYSNASGKSFASSPREYYSKLNPIEDIKLPGNGTLCINAVAYQRDKVEKTSNMEIAEYQVTGETPTEVPLFKSPAYLSAASMSLINLGHGSYVKLDRNTENYEPINPLKFTPIYKAEMGTPFLEYPSTGTSDNIYIVYIMPDEIYDAEIAYD